MSTNQTYASTLRSTPATAPSVEAEKRRKAKFDVQLTTARLPAKPSDLVIRLGEKLSKIPIKLKQDRETIAIKQEQERVQDGFPSLKSSSKAKKLTSPRITYAAVARLNINNKQERPILIEEDLPKPTRIVSLLRKCFNPLIQPTYSTLRYRSTPHLHPFPFQCHHRPGRQCPSAPANLLPLRHRELFHPIASLSSPTPIRPFLLVESTHLSKGKESTNGSEEGYSGLCGRVRIQFATLHTLTWLA